MHRWIGIGLAAATLAAGCGGSPNAPSASGLAITALQVQIQNQSDGSHGYTILYTVHNGGPAVASQLGFEGTLTAKGAQVRSYAFGYPSGRPVGVAQSDTPGAVTFTAPADVPLADSFTLTVHYDAGSGEQTVSRTTPLNQ